MEMGDQQPPNAQSELVADERLSCWKEIAAYLKREVRTVQRWEKTEALPVHRHVHSKRGSVYAYKSEIDAWWNNRRPRLEAEGAAHAQPIGIRRGWLLALGALLLAWLPLGLWQYWPRLSSKALGQPPTSAVGHAESHINIRTYIDGRSWLILRGQGAWWHHMDYAAPGRDDGANLPTVINGIEWFPVWPKTSESQQSFCNCFSDVFGPLRPPIPERTAAVQLQIIRGRHRVTVMETPAAANGFAVVLEFDDNEPMGSDWYEVNLIIRRGDR